MASSLALNSIEIIVTATLPDKPTPCTSADENKTLGWFKTSFGQPLLKIRC